MMRLRVLEKNIKKRDFSEVESEDDSEELEVECETGDDNGCNRKN